MSLHPDDPTTEREGESLDWRDGRLAVRWVYHSVDPEAAGWHTRILWWNVAAMPRGQAEANHNLGGILRPPHVAGDVHTYLEPVTGKRYAVLRDAKPFREERYDADGELLQPAPEGGASAHG